MEKNENFKPELANQYSILIKASAKEERERGLVIISILVMTFVAVLVSIMFSYKAYQSSTSSLGLEPKESSTYYQTLSIVYDTDHIFNLDRIGNGYILRNPKRIKITNDGNKEIKFDIILNSINTSLLSTSNLVYTLIINGEIKSEKEFPLTEKAIAKDLNIAPGETIDVELRVTFKGTFETNNYSNYYHSNIMIVPKDNRSDLLE